MAARVSNQELRRLEQQFQQLADRKRCKVCASRTSKCPSCHSPIGFTPKEVADGERDLIARIEAIAARTPPHNCLANAIDNMTDGELAEALAQAMARRVRAK